MAISEVSHALKSLQSEKLAISGVLRDITGTESDDDISKLRLFFDEINKDATVGALPNVLAHN